nr:1027_t:CDS:2 [Entrophospora candida]
MNYSNYFPGSKEELEALIERNITESMIINYKGSLFFITEYFPSLPPVPIQFKDLAFYIENNTSKPFMLFRSIFNEEYGKHSRKVVLEEVSGLASRSWRKLSPNDKKIFKDFSEKINKNRIIVVSNIRFYSPNTNVQVSERTEEDIILKVSEENVINLQSQKINAVSGQSLNNPLADSN